MAHSPQRVKILHIISDTYSITGPANSLLTLLDHLPRERYDSSVGLRESGSLADEIGGRKIACFFLSLPKPTGWNAVRFCFRMPLAIAKLVVFVRRNKVDLIHVHQSQSLWGLIAGRLCGVPVVFHAREIVGNRAYKRLLLALSTRVIAISGAVRDHLVKGLRPGSKNKIAVVYNAVDLDRFDPGKIDRGVRREFAVPEQSPLVLMVSKLIALKGHLDFIEACRLLAARFPGAVFMIVGGELPGHERYARRVRRAVIDAGLQKRMRLVGFRRDIERFLAAADLVVQPSTCEEGLGRVIIEAMGLAKPVVATVVGGIPEVVVHSVTGYLVPKNDPASLAEAIAALLDDEELRREFGQAGARRAREVFAVCGQVEAISRIYEQTVNREPVGGAVPQS